MKTSLAQGIRNQIMLRTCYNMVQEVHITRLHYLWNSTIRIFLICQTSSKILGTSMCPCFITFYIMPESQNFL